MPLNEWAKERAIINFMNKYLIIAGGLVVVGLIGLFTLTDYLRLFSLILISVGFIWLIKVTMGKQPPPPAQTDYTDPLT